MASALRAVHLHSPHPQSSVLFHLHLLRRDRLVKARPPRSGVVLRLGVEERLAAADTSVRPRRLLIPVHPGESALGAVLPCDTKLFGSELSGPLLFGFLDLLGHCALRNPTLSSGLLLELPFLHFLEQLFGLGVGVCFWPARDVERGVVRLAPIRLWFRGLLHGLLDQRGDLLVVHALGSGVAGRPETCRCARPEASKAASAAGDRLRRRHRRRLSPGGTPVCRYMY